MLIITLGCIVSFLAIFVFCLFVTRKRPEPDFAFRAIGERQRRIQEVESEIAWHGNKSMRMD